MRRRTLGCVAYGAVDELNSHLGVVLAGEVPEALRAPLERIQNELFDLGADLSTFRTPRTTGSCGSSRPRSTSLEALCDRFNERLPALKSFVLPGGSETAARLHVARDGGSAGRDRVRCGPRP